MKLFFFTTLLFIYPTIAFASNESKSCTCSQSQSEINRIKRHLQKVEKYLMSRNTSHLSHTLRRNRKYAIQYLREYRLRGKFPRNIQFPGQDVPHFIDSFGTACAVGYLMIRSGFFHVAQKVSKNENFAFVREIKTPEAHLWIAQSGLSVDECAMIQPTYSCDCNKNNVNIVCGKDGTR